MNSVDVGDRLRLWSKGTATPFRHQKRLLISSHGIPRLFNRQFVVPANMELVFYGPHGVALLDPGFSTVARGWVQPYQTIGPGIVCPDYSLSKFQGFRSSIWAGLFGPLAKPFVGQGVETYEEIEDFLQTTAIANAPDILTLRASPGTISLTLSFVLQELITEGYLYDQILCAFCRGLTGGYGAPGNRPIFGGPEKVNQPAEDDFTRQWKIEVPRPVQD